MLPTMQDLADRLQRLDKVVRDVKTKQVYQKGVTQDVRDIVDRYFRADRERFIIGGLTARELSELDGGMQHLLEVAQKHSMVQTYRSQIKKLLREIQAMERSALTAGVRSSAPEFDATDRLIIETLSRLLPSAARSYEQAIRDLRSSERLSWRGPATDFRESLRETLDHLAPDADVIAEPGFKLEKEASLPTMKQKVRFILRKRGTSKTVMQSPEAAAQAVDEIVGTFVRSVYSRSSVSTHTPTDRDEILRIRDWVRVALCELLEVRTGA
jgi:hypothetical protein